MANEDFTQGLEALSSYANRFTSGSHIPVHSDKNPNNVSATKQAAIEAAANIKRSQLAAIGASYTASQAVQQENRPAQPAQPIDPNQFTREELMRQFAAYDEGLGTKEGTFLHDLGRLTTNEMRTKYGDNYDAIARGMQEAHTEYRRMGNISRDIWDTAKDTGLGLVSGVGTAVGGAAALGGVVSDGLSDALGLDPNYNPASRILKGIEKAGKGTSEFLSDLKSDDLRDIQKYGDIVTGVHTDASKEIYEKELASGESKFAAGLRRVGRDIRSSGAVLLDNPAIIGDMASENAANLVLATVTGGAAGKAIVASRLSKAGKSASEIAAHLSTKAGKAEVIAASAAMQQYISGAQEAGGAAMEMRQEASKWTEDFLKEKSPEYNNLIKEGKTHEQAFDILRRRATRESAAVAGASGILFGSINKGFEAAPLLSKGPGSSLRSMFGEMAEEAGMGFTGELGQNIAVSRHADKSQDLLEGVGKAVSEGAITAGALTGGLQAPGAAYKGAGEAVRGAAKGAGAALSGIKAVAEARAKTEADADNPLSEEKLRTEKAESVDKAVEAIISPEVTDITENTAEVTEAAEVTAEEPKVEDSPEIAKIRETVKEVYKINDEEHDTYIPDEVKALYGEDKPIPRDRFDFLFDLKEKFKGLKNGSKEKAAVAAEINQQLIVMSSLSNDEVTNLVNTMDPSDPFRSLVGNVQDFARNIPNQPDLVEAVEYLRNPDNIAKASEVSEDSTDTDVSMGARVIAAATQENPLAASPENISNVLDLVRKRKIQLPKEIVAQLEAALDISKVAELYSDTVAEVRGSKDPNRRRGNYDAVEVRDQIMSIGWQSDLGSKTKESVLDHIKKVTDLKKAGRNEEAALALQNLTNFVSSQINKLNALNESSKTKQAHGYMAYNPATDSFYDTATLEKPDLMKYQPHDENGRKFYDMVFADTSLATAVQNVLSNQFPELGVKPLELPKKSPSVVQRSRLATKLEEATKALRKPKPKKAKVKAKAESKTESKTEVKSEPKPKEEVKEEVKEEDKEETVSHITERNIEETYKGTLLPNIAENSDRRHSMVALESEPHKSVEEALSLRGMTSSEETVKKLILDLVPKITDTMNKRVKWILNKNPKLLEHGKAGKEWRMFPNVRPTVFTRTNEDGSQTYDRQVSEIATMAVMGVVTRLAPNPKMDLDKALSRRGNEGATITREVANHLRNYESEPQLVKKAAEAIKDSLGVKIKKDVPLSESDGSFQALAKEILDILISNKMLEQETITTDKDVLSGIKISENYFSEGELKDIRSNSDFISSMLTMDMDKKYYVGEPPSKEMLRSRQKATGAALSRKQRLAQEFQSQIPFKINMPFLSIVKALGPNTMAAIRGYHDYESVGENQYNQNDIIVLEGKNQSIRQEIQDTLEAVERIEQYALEHDMDPEDVNMYYAFEYTSVNRLQTVGPASGQNNKFARPTLRSTVATLDLTKDSHKEGFWRTVLQMSGTRVDGKKIEHLSTQQIMGDFEKIPAQEAIQEKYGEVISALEDHIKNPNKKVDSELFEKALKGTEPVVLESLVAVARFNIAQRENKLTEFKHMVPLEADGVSNGPAAIIVKFSTGAFNAHQIEQFERAGLFLGSKDNPRSLDTKEADGDLYLVTSKNAEVLANRMQETLSEPKVIKHRDAVNRLLKHFAPKGLAASLSDDLKDHIAELSLDRDAAKNPMTKTGYGAGLDGVSLGLTKDILSKIYSEMSKHIQDGGNINDFGYDGFFNDINLLTNGHISYNSKSGEYYIETRLKDSKVLSPKDLSKFTLNSGAVEAVSKSLNHVYVGPLYEATLESFGTSYETMQHIIKATSIQSAVLKHLFQKYLDTFKRNTSPTPKELDEWAETFKNLGAVINTEDQEFIVGSRETGAWIETDAKGERRSKISLPALSGNLTSGMQGYSPSLAGVSAAPYINIGAGDGLMMTRALAIAKGAEDMIKGLDRVLQIYDGLEMPADSIKEIGEHINSHAFGAWMDPTMDGVLDSFENFVRNFNTVSSLKNMSDEEAYRLFKDINKFTDIEPHLAKKNIAGRIAQVLEDLRSSAVEIKARSLAIQDVNTWTDQMAAAGAPYFNEGKAKLDIDLDGMSFAEKAHLLETRRLHHLAQLTDTSKDKKKEAIINEKLDENFDKFTNNVPGTNIKEIVLSKSKGHKQLRGLFNLMSPQSKGFYRDILKDNLPDDLGIYYGTAEELQKFRDEFYPNPSDPTPLSKTSGKYDPNHNVVFLVRDEGDGSSISETVIHELTHVAIAGKIEAYYNDPSSLAPPVREAVNRLVVLANDFMDLDFTKDTKEIRNKVEELREMLGPDRSMNKKALNEIITAIVTNPELSKVANQQRVSNPLLKITKAVIDAIKKLFPGFNRGAGVTYFSNALFNIEILSKSPWINPPMNPDPGSTDRGREALNMLRMPTSEKAALTSDTVRSALQGALEALERDMGLDPGKYPMFTEKASLTEAIKAEEAFTDFTNAGFDFNPEEALTFKQITTLFMLGTKMNGPALVRAEQIFDKALEELTPESFMENPDLDDPSDRMQADKKYNTVLGIDTKHQKDIHGRSMVLPKFLALAATNKEFSDILKKIDAPSREALDFSSVDSSLGSVTNYLVDTLVETVVHENKGSNISEATMNVIAQLLNFEVEKQTTMENIYQNSVGKIDEYAGELLEKGATKAAQKLEELGKATTSAYVKAPLFMAQGIASIMSKKEGAKYAEFVTSVLNTTPLPYFVGELFAELKGRTPDIAKIYDMVKKVRTHVSVLRQKYRVEYPKIIAEKFSRKLTKAEKTAMFRGWGETDITALMGAYSFAQIGKVYISDVFRDSEIKRNSANLTKEQLDRANQLADYMVNKKAHYGMLRNAYMIRELNGKIGSASEAQIDTLVTLLAVDKLNQETRDTLAALFNTERKGVEFSLTQLKFFRDLENNKSTDPIIRMNQWKGYMPSEGKSGTKIILAEKKDHKKLAYKGYTFLEDYNHMTADFDGSNYAWYITHNNSLNPYTQGVAQTAEVSQNGVDPLTGRTVNGNMGGVITGPYLKMVKGRLNQGNTSIGDGLVPVFGLDKDKNKVIVAYERPIPPELIARKEKNTDFGEMLGAMAGRQVEEAQGIEFNRQLVKNVFDKYKEDSARHNEYINLATSKDPIHKDTWNAIPRDMKEALKDAFGQPDMFMVRTDLIPMAVGYRNAGVSDIWTGNTRLHPKVREGIQELLKSTYGRKAYDHFVGSSRVWSSVVSEAKNIIVVKSMLVPFVNFTSNILQLVMNGVPIRTILTLGSKKLIEIDRYLDNQQRRFRLEADLRMAKSITETKQLQAKIDNLDAANQRMSIWPLIEAGEFGTIAEELKDVEVSLREGKFGEWVESQVENLPESVKTLGKYAVVSKTTTLYKGLNRATQYGDFLAKAVLFDHKVNTEKVSKEEALAHITEEFVNYDIPPGRLRTFLEEYGLLWFANFKLRSLKVAIRNIRDHPLRVVLGIGVEAKFSFLGSAVTDNIAPTLMDGRFWRSTGIGMGLRAPFLNPWLNLIT